MKKGLILGVILTIPLAIYAMSQLTSPLDPISKKIISEEVERVMNEKIFDVASKKLFVWQTFFESLDGLLPSNGATIDATNTGLKLLTSGVANDTDEVRKVAAGQTLMTFYDRSRIRVGVILASVTSVTAYLTAGDVQGGVGGYGFKIVGNSLKGVVHNGSAEATLNLMTMDTNNHNLQADFNPGVGVIFTVDNVERGTITTGLPSGVLYSAGPPITSAPTTNSTIMHIYVKDTSAGVAKQLNSDYFQYWQFRNRKTAS